jgi:hypothetical protein
MDREKGHDTANNFDPKTRVIVASGGKDEDGEFYCSINDASYMV